MQKVNVVKAVDVLCQKVLQAVQAGLCFLPIEGILPIRSQFLQPQEDAILPRPSQHDTSR